MEPYQKMIAELESKINMLAKTDLNLEDSLKIYEEAMAIYKKCVNRLREAEGKLLKIKEDADGKITEETVIMEEDNI